MKFRVKMPYNVKKNWFYFERNLSFELARYTQKLHLPPAFCKDLMHLKKLVCFQ